MLAFSVQNARLLCYDEGGDFFSCESGSWLQTHNVLAEWALSQEGRPYVKRVGPIL